MPGKVTKIADLFSGTSAGYALHRPNYPPELAGALASLAPARHLALDLGCGTGQFSLLLAEHFDGVMATDISPEQIAHAAPHPRVRYVCEAAEKISACDDSIDLVVAAQAAHWFALPAFYGEVRRVAVPRAVVALITYGILVIDGDLNGRFQRFYRHEIAPYWPAERRHVETGYANLDFPFDEFPAPEAAIVHDWDLGRLLGYVRTWTATRQAERAGQGALVTAFENDMAALWGAPDRKRRISWPLAMRIGRV